MTSTVSALCKRHLLVGICMALVFIGLANDSYAFSNKEQRVYSNPLGYHPLASKPWAGINLPMTSLVKLHPLVRKNTTPFGIEGWRGRVLAAPWITLQNTSTHSVVLNAAPLRTEGTHQLWLYGGLLDSPPLDSNHTNTPKHFPIKVNPRIYTDVASTAGRALFLHRAHKDTLDPTTGLLLYAGHLTPKAWASTGGWYEGGNYDIHALTQAVTSFYLLEAAHLEGKKPLTETLSFNYPIGSKPTGGGLSDAMTEASVGLNWLMRHQQQHPHKRIPTAEMSIGHLNREVKPATDSRTRRLLPPSQEVALLSGIVLRHASQRVQEADPDLAVRTLLATEGIKQSLLSRTPWENRGNYPLLPTSELSKEKADTAPYQPIAWWVQQPWPTAQRASLVAWWQQTLQMGQGQPFQSAHTTALLERLSHWMEQNETASTLASLAMMQPTAAPSTAPPNKEGNALIASLSKEVWQPLLFTQWLAYAEQWPETWKHTFLERAEAGVRWSHTLLESPFASPWNNHLLALSNTLQTAPSSTDLLPPPSNNPQWLTLGIHLAQAYKLTQDERYFLASQAIWNYLLGYNSWQQPFLTGDPEASQLPLLRNPCNQLVRSSGRIIPGLLVAGPTPTTEDTAHYPDQGDSCQLNTTHPTWQAQLVYWGVLMNELMSTEAMAKK